MDNFLQIFNSVQQIDLIDLLRIHFNRYLFAKICDPKPNVAPINKAVSTSYILLYEELLEIHTLFFKNNINK